MIKSTLLLLAILTIATTHAQQFKVKYTAPSFDGPFTGHVILYLSKTATEPRKELYEPCYGLVVKRIRPGEEITFDNNAVFFPQPLTNLERGTYFVQAVWDRNLGGRNIGTSPGNIYSSPVQVTLGDDTAQTVTLTCDQTVPQPVFTNSTYVKEMKAPSTLLTKFWHHPMTVDGAVLLPSNYYTEPARKFPVVFMISGYGGDYYHYSAEHGDTMPAIPLDTFQCIKVYLDGNCSLGHMVYANSDNTGPWGDALAKEFIPQLKKTYRCNGAFLAKGHSSGGWACLWLQIHYPKLFAGVNASAPDPVDFRSFVRCDRYAAEPKKNLNDFEGVVYRGEQVGSFNAVYGPRGKDGQPIPLFDPVTGQVNRDVLEHWKRYDISIYLRNNWDKLKAGLRDKIRISVGNEDDYGLNLPVHLLEDEMKKIGATITFAYYPGAHFTVATAEYRRDQDNWLAAKYREWLVEH